MTFVCFGLVFQEERKCAYETVMLLCVCVLCVYLSVSVCLLPLCLVSKFLTAYRFSLKMVTNFVILEANSCSFFFKFSAFYDGSLLDTDYFGVEYTRALI